MMNATVFKQLLLLICGDHGIRPLSIDHGDTLCGLVERAGGVVGVVIDEGHGCN